MKIKEICGLCSCGEKLTHRILPPIKGEKAKIWLIHSFCKKEKKVLVQAIFYDDVEPVFNRDYYIEENKKVKMSKVREIKSK